MKRNSKNSLERMFGLLAFAALTLAGAHVAAAQEASSTYKGSPRDPFVNYKPSVKRVAKVTVTVVQPPTIEQRIKNYKAQKAAAMSAQMPAPKPTTALLLSELQVVGINRTPRGYAAMVEATPIKLTYVVYPGENFYDGMLVAIEENRLVLRRETRFSNGNKQQAVEMKPLRQPNAVADSMAATKKSAAPAAAATEPPPAEEPKSNEEESGPKDNQ